MSPFDLDALAARSGLSIPLSARQRPITIPVQTLVIALAIAVTVAVTALATAAVMRLAHAQDARLLFVEHTAPRACAERWPHSKPLFTEPGDLTASVACGNSHDRVVLGRVEIAYP